jgi:hypothetical protein
MVRIERMAQTAFKEKEENPAPRSVNRPEIDQFDGTKMKIQCSEITIY